MYESYILPKEKRAKKIITRKIANFYGLEYVSSKILKKMCQCEGADKLIVGENQSPPPHTHTHIHTTESHASVLVFGECFS